MNLQEPEKRVKSVDGTLEVHSIFYTIQGEGPFCGTPAVFIRLAGCNLQCPGCDTDYTSQRRTLTPEGILVEVQARHKNFEPRLVVITGGEPFRQDIKRLCELLTQQMFFVQVETNGTLQPPDLVYNVDIANRTGVYVVVSPKTGKVHKQIERIACAYKYVLSSTHVSRDDGLPTNALNHPANPQLARPPEWFKRPIYLQPMDMHKSIGFTNAGSLSDMNYGNMLNRINLKACVQSCMKYGYILQLQVHKIIGVD